MAIYNIYNLYKEYAEVNKKPLRPDVADYQETIAELLKIPSIRSQIPEHITDRLIIRLAFLDSSDEETDYYEWTYFKEDIEEGIRFYEKDSISVHYNVSIKPNRVLIGEL